MCTFSVVIPWRDRPELKQTMAANAAFFERHAAEVLVVNCGGDPDALADILSEQPVTRLRHVFMRGAAFNRSLAKNIGALCSSGRYVFFLDADITLISDFLKQAYPALERGKCFVHVHTVYESQLSYEPKPSQLREVVHAKQLVFQDGRVARLRTREGMDGSSCGPGLIVMDRQDFIEVGGFNSTLVDWGYEDFDLQIRLQLLRNLAHRSMGKVLHASHGDDRRAAEGVNVRQSARRNQWTCTENYNRGMFLGTYHEDAREWLDRKCEIPRASQPRVSA